MDMTLAKMNVKLSYSRWDFIVSLAFLLFISISLLRWWINTGDSSQILLITNTHCDDNFTSLKVTHNLIPTNQPRDKVPSSSAQLWTPKRWFIFFLRKCIWRKRGEAWRERLRRSLKEGSHWDKRYQIDEGDDEAGCRRREMISLNCNHCCCQQSWHSSGWKILRSGRKRLRHERNTQKKLSFSILRHWNSSYCANCKTQKLQPTAKLLLASPGFDTADVALQD